VEVNVRLLRIAAVAMVAAMFLYGPAFAFKEGAQTCIKCHTLNERDLVPMLEKVNLQGARILSIQMSPIKGLWEVAVENRNQRFVIYVDFSKKYIGPGPFIDYANKKDITRERIEQLNKDRKVDLSKLSLENALIVGKADAPVRVVVFTDPG
jgi:thiol:disulfide interchange protein DsbC